MEILFNWIKRLMPVLENCFPESFVKQVVGNFCPVFMLHRISDDRTGVSGHSIEHIDKCLIYLRRKNYNPVSLQAVVDMLRHGVEIPLKTVAFTIDDGFVDHAELGGSVFAKYDIPLTCFVITGFLDGDLWPWDDQVSYIIEKTKLSKLAINLPSGEGFEMNFDRESRTYFRRKLRDSLKRIDQTDIYQWLDRVYARAEVVVPKAPPDTYLPMTWVDAKKFTEKGHTIAPHTVSHRILSQLNSEDSSFEIKSSMARVREVLGGDSTVFAYPTGSVFDFTKREQETLKGLGVQGAVSTRPQVVEATSSLFDLPRYSLPDNFADFVKSLSVLDYVKSKVLSKS